jgi:hypothetical protein
MIAMLMVMSDMDLSHDLLSLVGFESSRFGSWYAASAKSVCMVHGLATSGMHVRVVWFWLQV